MSADEKSSRNNVMIVLITGGIGLGLTIVSAPFLIIPAIHRLPFMVSPLSAITRSLKSLPPPPLRVVDLGSGDGRFIIEAAKKGYHGVGFELNPLLVSISYYNAYKAGVLKNVSFKMDDFWKVNLSKFDVIACFGVKSIMAKLNDKIITECEGGIDKINKKNVSIICYRFPLEGRKWTWKEDELFFYRTGGINSSSSSSSDDDSIEAKDFGGKEVDSNL